jgi:hypothetical protein
MRLTRAVTHVRLCDANHAKIAALDALIETYLRLCQQYTTSTRHRSARIQSRTRTPLHALRLRSRSASNTLPSSRRQTSPSLDTPTTREHLSSIWTS